MCGSKEYSVLDYHTEKEHAIVIDSIKCVDCGKVYFSFKRLTIDDM